MGQLVPPLTPMPAFPVSSLVMEGDGRRKCRLCGSSLQRRWWFRLGGCMQPACANFDRPTPRQPRNPFVQPV